MPVVRLWLLVLLQPFHKPSIGPNLIWGEPGALLNQLLAEVLVEAESFRGPDASGKQVPNKLLQHGRPHANGGLTAIGQLKMVFRRIRRGNHQPVAARPFNPPSREDVGRSV